MEAILLEAQVIDEYAKYSEKRMCERNMLRLKRKFDTARKLCPSLW
ncbi:MAG: hypothetical protein R2865_05360 [Deinococcales bacterium]